MTLLLAGAASSVVAALLLSPGLAAGPSLDAAVFALAGQLLRNGFLPYTSVWDHKPPIIYLVDGAAQLALPGVDPWVAAWLASVIAIGLTGTLVAKLLVPIAGRTSAIVAGAATAAAASQYVVSLGGGLTESVAILPAALALALAAGGTSRRFALAGVAVGVAAMTSIPAIAVVGAVGVIAWRDKERGPAIVALVSGTIAAGAIGLALLAAAGMLPAAIDAVVGYSGAFHTLSGAGSAGNGAQWSGATLSLVFLAVPAGLGALAGRRSSDPRVRTLALACVAWVALAIVLFVAEGRFETHYATVAVVPLGVLAGMGLQRTSAIAIRSRALAVTPVAAGLLISGLVIGLSQPTMMRPTSAETDRTMAVAHLVDARTGAGARVFVWGNEPGIYLWSGRLPASRYVYVYPLMTPGYSTATQVDELVRHLAANPPQIIVDAGSFSPGTPGLPPLLVPRPVDAGDPRILDLIAPLRTFVRAHYRQTADVDGWPVYELMSG